jgi:hypothetical protein
MLLPGVVITEDLSNVKKAAKSSWFTVFHTPENPWEQGHNYICDMQSTLPDISICTNRYLDSIMLSNILEAKPDVFLGD